MLDTEPSGCSLQSPRIGSPCTVHCGPAEWGGSPAGEAGTTVEEPVVTFVETGAPHASGGFCADKTPDAEAVAVESSAP